VGHLWFILFLFVFSLVSLPVLLWLRNRGGRRVVRAFGRAAQAPALLILLPVLVLVLPWLENEDDFSGQPPIGLFLVFVLGFLLLGDERIGRTIERHWVWMLGLGVAASLAYIVIEPRTGGWPDTAAVFAGVKIVYEVGVWCMILGLLGLSHRYLMLPGPALTYATEAAYPFYILHQTVIIVVAYFVVQWDWPSGLKFAAIASASFALSLLIYEVAVRRWRFVRPLFGMKPKRRRTS